jgi:hypothetical protein
MSLPKLRPAVVMILVLVASAALVPCAVAQRLTLTLTPLTISFPSADPDATPSIAAAPVTVTYRIRNSGGANWQITMQASGDLTAGTAIISASNITWAATPVPPFQDGTLSASVPQRLAAGSGDVTPSRTGTVIFSLANAWTHNVGTYTTSIVFTLTCP